VGYLSNYLTLLWSTFSKGDSIFGSSSDSFIIS